MKGSTTKVICVTLAENGKSWKDVAAWLGVTSPAVTYKKQNEIWNVSELRILAKKLKWTDEQKVRCLSQIFTKKGRFENG